MLKQIKLTIEQKSAVLKLFTNSERMEQLANEFKKSFKVLEGRQNGNNKGSDPDSYMIWSSVLNRTIEVPTTELLQ
jgi:hypothetical protein